MLCKITKFGKQSSDVVKLYLLPITSLLCLDFFLRPAIEREYHRLTLTDHHFENDSKPGSLEETMIVLRLKLSGLLRQTISSTLRWSGDIISRVSNFKDVAIPTQQPS